MLPKITKDEVLIELSKRKIKHFAKSIYPTNVLEPFHESYYKVLDLFCKEKIKNLIITMPPQHGKSEGSTRLLPAKILGDYPDKKVAIGSYSTTFARKFNRSIQRIIDSEDYHSIYPNTILNSSKFNDATSNYIRNADEFEIVEKKGSLKAVGRGGSLTGNAVDVMIMDDLYKDEAEGNSPVIRDSVIGWYSSVVEKRLHNDSQQLIVFTRWHEEDLIGYLESESIVVEVSSFAQIEEEMLKDPDTWIKINYEAIKESEKTELDDRDYGQALWGDRHSIKKLEGERKKKPHMFDCMNQGKPESKEGLLYRDFIEYSPNEMPDIKKRGNYTDTADMGDDFLCSICYNVSLKNDIYVTDIEYTPEAMEITEVKVSDMINRNVTMETYIESNNGGRGFARVVENRVSSEVIWFHQSSNKESRILTNAPEVNKILMPLYWQQKWPLFASHLRRYKRMFKANKQDDAPDCLTGIIEKEGFMSEIETEWN